MTLLRPDLKRLGLHEMTVLEQNRNNFIAEPWSHGRCATEHVANNTLDSRFHIAPVGVCTFQEESLP